MTRTDGPATPSAPVLIVGAGPTGLTAALVLAQSGVPCRILDKRSEAGHSSRALGLQARSMEVLAGLGVTDEIERMAYRLRGSSIMKGRRRVVTLDWVPPESRFPYTYVLPQAGLEEILRTRLAALGVEVEREIEIVDVRADGGGVVAELAGGASLSADWLIGADGARSAVRTALGIGFPEYATGEVYHLADAVLDLPIELDDGAMWLGPDGPLMLMRLPGDDRLWRVFVDVTDASRGADLPPLEAAALTRLLEARGPGGITVDELQWSSVFRTRMGLADSYRSGRVLLAGDATHVFPPFGGQGMNLGIQDAVNLAWRLTAVLRGAGASLLDRYERERRPVADAVIDDVEGRRRLYALRHPVARAGRDVLLGLGGRSRRLERRSSLQNSQLNISYRDRTPGGDHGPSPRPGDRAPHARVGDTSLHELFGPDHATLLLCGLEAGSSLLSAGAEVRIVHLSGADGSDRESCERYGFGPAGEGWVLVRPDGYVAARGAELAKLQGALEAMSIG
ncbi:FAD-dependent monooxygenase [Brachybacterium sp. AOP43-C2-M15]|uniref:FAD-dependent monooxygenase n=1 Tax=Brachybacterium sp. AOP43-C2-M15 TaxID=3457661 RepID=UPI0040343E40